ncbi:ankyrin [Acephala macrosclerotiorum]|nr:ankyrin [Acephala macrosclerotiorum]
MKSDRDRHGAIHRANPFIFRCKFPGCKFKGTPRRDYLLRHMRKSHESSRDSASKDSVRFYYQKSSIEATVSESEETLLAFLDAVGQGDESLVKEFISAKVEFCGKDSRGTTAGDIAAAKGYRGILQLLVDAGADVNSNTSNPWLHQALRNGHLETAEFLLEVGADINAKTSFGYGSSTLFEEVLLSSSESAIALVERYQPLPPEQSRLQLLLNEAIEHEDLPRMARLVDLSASVGQLACDRSDSGYVRLPLHVLQNKELSLLQRSFLTMEQMSKQRTVSVKQHCTKRSEIITCQW